MTATAPFPTDPVPCLTWDGQRVVWERWEVSPPILCAKGRVPCGTCGWDGAGHVAAGRIHVPARTETLDLPRSRKPGEARQWVTVQRDRPAGEWMALLASLCPRCGRIDVTAVEGSGDAAHVLCDGCDALAAVGASFPEARATLAALGGSTYGEDVDLCPTCTTGQPPRAAAAIRLAGGTGTKELTHG